MFFPEHDFSAVQILSAEGSAAFTALLFPKDS